MAIIDDRNRMARIASAATGIKSQCATLQGLSGVVTFDRIMNPLNQIVLARDQDITPSIALGAATINEYAADNLKGWPADTHAALVTLQSALSTFLTAYDALYDSAGNVMVFTVADGHTFLPLNVSALSSLAAPLAAVIAAAEPLAVA